MAASAELFARMFVIGIVVAAPVGAMGILCIQRVLAHGWRAGVATGAGIATADAGYAALAAFGVTAVSQWLIAYEAPLRILGGLGLVWLGWRALRTRPARTAAVAVDSPRLGLLYSSAVGLTFTNPLTIMAFAAIFAGAGLVAQAGTGQCPGGDPRCRDRIAQLVARTVHRRLGRAPCRERPGHAHREPGVGGPPGAFGVLALAAGVRGLG